MTTDTLQEAALSYAARGWRVFPCQPRDKKPIPWLKWKAEATTDAAMVRQWWAENPEANIGLVTDWPNGPGVVLDVDNLDLLEEVPETLPSDRMTITGKGGRHYFLAPPEGETIGNGTGNLPKGKADVRGCGTGYVLAPPSVHPNGDRYVWGRLADGDPPPMPAWLLQTIKGEREWAAELAGYSFDASAIDTTPREPLSARERARLWLAKAGPAIQGSQGQTTLFTVASQMAGFGLSLDEATDLLWTEFNPRCVPPWKGGKEEGQFRRHVREGWSKGPVTHGSKLDAASLPPAVPGSGGSGDHNDSYRAKDTTQPPSGPLFDGPPTRGLVPDDPPPFPVDALPPWLAQWVREATSACKVRVDIPATLALGVASCAASYGPKDDPVKAQYGTFSQPLNLYCVAMEDSGSNKSGALYEALSPLREADSQIREAGKAERATRDAAIEEVEARIAGIKSDIKKAVQTGGKPWKGDPMEELQSALQDARAEREALPNPAPCGLIVSDITPEAMALALAANDGLCLATAEGQEVFDLVAGRYGNGPNMEIFMKAWSRETHQRDRVVGASMVVEAPMLSLAIAVQPVTVRRMGELPGALEERGVVGRLLFAFPRSIVGHRTPPSVGAEISHETRAAYHEGIRRLFETRAAGRIMTFGPAAIALADDAHRWLEPRRGEGGDLHWCSSMASKLDAYLVRFAGLLHLADGGDPGGAISADVVNRALKLVHYFLAHGIKAWRLMKDGEDPPEAKVWRVLQKWATEIQPPQIGFANSHKANNGGGSANMRTGFRGLTERDLFERVKGSKSIFPSVEALQAHIGRLAEAGYVATVTETREGPGRRPTWIVMNPDA